MLSIRIGSSYIPYLPGINLPLVIRSAFFLNSDSRVPGSYIFNNTVPKTEAIMREFNQAHRFQRHGRATAELPYLIQDGTFRLQGTCIVTDASDESYDIAYRVDNGEFAGKIKDKTLKDLNLGEDITIATVASAAHNEPRLGFDLSYSLPNIIPVTDYFHYIDMDITNSLSADGKSFTAQSNITVSFSLKCFLYLLKYGRIKYFVSLNGTDVYDGFFETEGESEFTHIFTLDQGDIVSVRLEAWTTYSNEHYQYKILLNIDLVSVLFQTSSVFDDIIHLDQDTCDYTIFPIMNAKLLDNFPDDYFLLDNLSLKTLYNNYFKTLNYFVDGKFPLTMSGAFEDSYFYAANLFTPFVYMSKLLREIGIISGYTIVNNPFDIDVEYKGAVLFNAYAENTYSSEDTHLVPVKPTFNLIDHVPEIKLSDFISWTSVATGYMYFVDNNELTITFHKIGQAHIKSESNPAIPFPGIILSGSKVKVDPEYQGIKFELKKSGPDAYQAARIKEIHDKLVYKGSVNRVTDLPGTGNVVNDMYLVTDNASFFVWQYNPELYTLTWWFYSKDWPLVYKEGADPYLTVTTEFSPVLTNKILDTTPGAPSGRLWTIPVTEQAGILEGFPDSLGAEYGNQMLIYKGMSLDSQGEPYPLGTCRLEDYSGNAYFVNFNARDTFNNQYKDFLKWLAYSAKPGTLRVLLTPAQLKMLKIWRIYEAETFDFLIKEIRVNMLADGLSIAELDIYTC